MNVHFEALEDMYKEEKATTKSAKRKSRKSMSGEDEIEVSDLVMVENEGVKFYGLVTKITTSKSGDKVWALWNEKKDKAIKKLPSKIVPIESAEKVSKVELIKKGDEL